MAIFVMSTLASFIDYFPSIILLIIKVGTTIITIDQILCSFGNNVHNLILMSL